MKTYVYLLIGSFALGGVPAVMAETPPWMPPPLEEPPGPWDAPKDFVFGWTPRVVGMLSIGDAKKGQELAKQHKCGRCHGDTGISDEDDTPSLAGQVAAYTYKQLSDYRTGARDDRSMLKVVKKLNRREMADLAAFYEVQQPEKKAGGEVPPLVDKGDRSRLLLACNDCHNETKQFRSRMEIPATLEGQKPEYFLETMIAFKEGERANDLFERMRWIASRLTDEEIEALSKYYSAPPTPEE